MSVNIDRFSRTTDSGSATSDDSKKPVRGCVRPRRHRHVVRVRADDLHDLVGRCRAFLSNIKASWKVAKHRAVKRGAYVSRTPWAMPATRMGRSPRTPSARLWCRKRSYSPPVKASKPRWPTWNGSRPSATGSPPRSAGCSPSGPILARPATETSYSLYSRTARVRRHLGAAQSTPSHRKPKADYPLSGLLACATCENPMVGAQGGRDHARLYRCSGGLTLSRDKCSRPAAITAKIIEDHLQRITQKRSRDYVPSSAIPA